MRRVPSGQLPSARGSGEDPIGGDKTTWSSIHRKHCMKIGGGGGPSLLLSLITNEQKVTWCK